MSVLPGFALRILISVRIASTNSSLPSGASFSIALTLWILRGDTFRSPAASGWDITFRKFAEGSVSVLSPCRIVAILAATTAPTRSGVFCEGSG